LLTSPPGSISFVLSTTSSHLDISASRACDIPASAPSISPQYDRPLQPRLPRRHSQHPAARHSGSLHPHPHLRLQYNTASTDHCSFGCPNNTSSRWLLDFLGPLVPPYLDARAPNGSLPFLQLGSCMTDLCSRVLPREPLLLCSLGCRPEHDRASTIGLTG
ncbi:hypothetical protein FOFC_03091, partial [Fusarium oxysporum]